jgi:xanthine dehydrogenase accessory factor
MTPDDRTHLYVLGAGPVGQQVAQLAAQLDFRVTVIDERASLLTPDRFPAATEIIHADFDALLPQLNTSPGDFVAIVTQVWQRDARALELLVDRPLAYLGMIGCQRKLEEIYTQLEAAGIERNRLSGIKAPIGLKIGSKSPAEIAVSICAELISVRRAKSAK